MKIEIIPCLSDNYSYLIIEKDTNTVSIIDPSEFSEYQSLDWCIEELQDIGKYAKNPPTTTLVCWVKIDPIDNLFTICW